MAGWGVPGMHKASRRSSAGGGLGVAGWPQANPPMAGWGVPGLHKASRRSSTGGISLFPLQQPSGGPPPGGSGAGWAAAVRVMAAEILLLRR